MKPLYFLVCILLSFYSYAQKDNKITLGKIDSLNSKILKEKRDIWIYVPNADGPQIYGKQRYPVLYLLDGDAHFYSVAGMTQQLSSVNGNTICPQMIIVGIPNTDRTRDLTPTHVDTDPPYMDSSSSKTSGGGENFISFIEKELIPHIDSLYPTEPYRMLVGHSFGGLTVINALVHHTKLFNSYVAIDPSMWWDKLKLLKETKTALSTQSFKGTSLFLGIANTMENGMDTAKVKNDTTSNSKHIRSILELSSYPAMNKTNQLNYAYKYYNDDDHGSVPLITEYDALRFIFSKYPLKLTFNDYINIDKTVIAKIETHFENVSKEFGYTMKPPEDLINSYGYQALSQKHNAEAEYLFKLNIANYPQSSNVFDSMGDLYEAKGDKTQAIENYKKALSIKEIPETRKKLKKLLDK